MTTSDPRARQAEALADARPLKLIRRFPTHPRGHAHSIEQHRIDSQDCLCHTLHGHCYAVRRACPQHVGEIH